MYTRCCAEKRQLLLLFQLSRLPINAYPYDEICGKQALPYELVLHTRVSRCTNGGFGAYWLHAILWKHPKAMIQQYKCPRSRMRLCYPT